MTDNNQAAHLPGNTIIDELVRRVGADAVCRRFNVRDIEQLRLRIPY